LTTRFVVLRHGETAWNREARIQGHKDSALSDEGLRQAEALGRRMDGEAVDAIVSSDLGRAYATAQFVARRTGHSVRVDARFRERSFGVGEGLTYEELDRAFPGSFSRVHETDPDFAIPGGESRRQFFVRVRGAFESLARDHRGQRIAVVTHGGVLGILYRLVHGIALSAPLPIPIANAAFNAVALHGSRWSVEAWGDTGHLGAVEAFPSGVASREEL
jgi:probable phosphoglycerate mutase